LKRSSSWFLAGSGLLSAKMTPPAGKVLVAAGGKLCLKFSKMARALSSAVTGEPEKFGRFYLRELLNSGGMAEIWLVTDGRGKPYALRKLKRELRFNFTARRRFSKGNEILAQLGDHEHIVGYVEHGRDYLLMDYVEAENLKTLAARGDPVVAENVAQILLDMAEGLAHIHENGYMHLDFKPENVLVSRNAAVRLIDFDTAQPLPEKPVKLSRNPGTPGYMAPEQLQRKPLDGRADLFAYGVVAYELLTHQKPFPGETPVEILRTQLDEEGPVPLREHNPDVPPELDRIVLKCLAANPEQRYAVAGMLLRDLQAALYV
jgi:eukaryotic-like serine/threonine-protein kinase